MAAFETYAEMLEYLSSVGYKKMDGTLQLYGTEISNVLNGHYKKTNEEDEIIQDLAKAIGSEGESVQVEWWVSHYYMNTGLLYINRGDTYDITVCFDTEQQEWFVGSWGDWYESAEGDHPRCEMCDQEVSGWDDLKEYSDQRLCEDCYQNAALERCQGCEKINEDDN